MKNEWNSWFVGCHDLRSLELRFPILKPHIAFEGGAVCEFFFFLEIVRDLSNFLEPCDTP